MRTARDTSSVVASIFGEYLMTPGMRCLTYNREITPTGDAQRAPRAVSFWVSANFLFNINVVVNLARTSISRELKLKSARSEFNGTRVYVCVCVYGRACVSMKDTWTNML